MANSIGEITSLPNVLFRWFPVLGFKCQIPCRTIFGKGGGAPGSVKDCEQPRSWHQMWLLEIPPAVECLFLNRKRSETRKRGTPFAKGCLEILILCQK